MKIYIGRYPSSRSKSPNAEQVKRIRIDKWDTWSMAETLADIILPMLKQLRDTKHGSPGDMPGFLSQSDNQWPQMTFDFYKDDDKTADNLGHKQWDDIMDKMIWSFEQICMEDRDSKFHTGEHDIIWVPVYDKNGKSLGSEMTKGPNDTAVFDYEGYKEYYNRIQVGLDLFGKYYLNLWD